MLAIILCIGAFAISIWTARRSVVAGLISVLAIGYFYGIVRANILSPFSHFIFDASLIGLYAGQLFTRLTFDELRRSATLRAWLAALIAWPLLVFFLPFQNPLISLVGLRGNLFFLPLCLFAVRLKQADWLTLSLALASLNVAALAFGGAQYFLGIERFYPFSSVTLIIYSSRDVAGFQFFRIPAIFTSAHAYAGTMVATLPLLIGAWSRPGLRQLYRWGLLAGMAAAGIGILLANTRSHAVAGCLILLAALFHPQLALTKRLVFCTLVVGAMILALSNDRLQRFTTLVDAEVVEGRIQGSVNRTFFEILAEYPMGNGLGGGGTSIPSFLEGQINKPMAMESEYARILLEQGIIGLLIWVGFILQLIINRPSSGVGDWAIARHLSWWCSLLFMGFGLIGMGTLTSIPQTALLMLWIGWAMVPESKQAVGQRRALVPRARVEYASVPLGIGQVHD